MIEILQLLPIQNTVDNLQPCIILIPQLVSSLLSFRTIEIPFQQPSL